MTYNEKARISTYKYRSNPLNQDRIKAINNRASKKKYLNDPEYRRKNLESKRLNYLWLKNMSIEDHSMYCVRFLLK
jgi:hypothetical protein